VGERLKKDGFKTRFHYGTFPESWSTLNVEVV
jgi:hypothetical protein